METSGHDIISLQSKVALHRDEEAYRQLFYHFYPPLTRFALGFLRSKESAEEVYADVMMNLWLLGETLNRIDNLKLYLYTSIRNGSLNYLNKYQKFSLVPIDEVALKESTTASGDDILTNEFQRNFAKAIQSLPPQGQLVYRLIKEEGFSYKETATLLNISVHSVETHMQRALVKLRNSVALYLRSGKN